MSERNVGPKGKGDDRDREMDVWLAGLRRLGPVTPDPAAADGTQRRARAQFVRFARLRQRPWVMAIERVYDRAEPAFAAGVVLVYLAWAVQTAAALIR